MTEQIHFTAYMGTAELVLDLPDGQSEETISSFEFNGNEFGCNFKDGTDLWIDVGTLKYDVSNVEMDRITFRGIEGLENQSEDYCEDY